MASWPAKATARWLFRAPPSGTSNVYLAPEKVSGVPIFQEVRVNSLNLYGTYGLTDKIDAIVSLPYIQSEGKADPRGD